MTTKIGGAVILLVSVAWMGGGGCDGRTIIGSPQTGTGGAPVAGGQGGTIVPGVGGATGAGGAPGVGGAIGVGGTPGVGGATGVGGAAGAGGRIANACPVAGAAATPTTIADMRSTLSRDWVLCSPLGLTHQRQAGLRITPADRYALLGRDAAGSLTAMSGADFEGSVEYLQLGTRVQVNLRSDIGFTIISAPVITTGPGVLIINNNGVFEYRYVRADENGGAAIPGSGSANGDTIGIGTCPVAGVAVTPQTVDGMRTAISRRWILCSPLGWLEEPQAGIEITAAGRYALLDRDASGAVVPLHGVDFEGSVTYMPSSVGGLIQVNFMQDLGGVGGAFPVITQNPTMMILPGSSTVYRYLLPDGS